MLKKFSAFSKTNFSLIKVAFRKGCAILTKMKRESHYKKIKAVKIPFYNRFSMSCEFCKATRLLEYNVIHSVINYTTGASYCESTFFCSEECVNCFILVKE